MIELTAEGLWTYFSTKVNNVGVWVIEGQEHSIAGVHLINSHGLLHVLLEIKYEDKSERLEKCKA